MCTNYLSLFFVDNCLLFFRANALECNRVQDCLSIYESASGQHVNFEKFVISFSANVPQSSLVSLIASFEGSLGS